MASRYSDFSLAKELSYYSFTWTHTRRDSILKLLKKLLWNSGLCWVLGGFVLFCFKLYKCKKKKQPQITKGELQSCKAENKQVLSLANVAEAILEQILDSV